MTKTISTLSGQAVRLQRQVLGLSQEELAWRAWLNRSYVTDVDRGSRNLPLSTLEKLATALETPLFVILRKMDKGGDSIALDALVFFPECGDALSLKVGGQIGESRNSFLA